MNLDARSYAIGISVLILTLGVSYALFPPRSFGAAVVLLVFGVLHWSSHQNAPSKPELLPRRRLEFLAVLASAVFSVIDRF
jgi:hypothetical protein